MSERSEYIPDEDELYARLSHSWDHVRVHKEEGIATVEGWELNYWAHTVKRITEDGSGPQYTWRFGKLIDDAGEPVELGVVTELVTVLESVPK